MPRRCRAGIFGRGTANRELLKHKDHKGTQRTAQILNHDGHNEHDERHETRATRTPPHGKLKRSTGESAMKAQTERPTSAPAIHPLVADKLPQVRELCRKHHVRTLWLFGSAAQGGFDPAKSDLDFAVEYLPETTYGFDGDWWVLKESLEALFARKVDLVAVEAIRNHYFREEVEETRVALYAA
jgi:hypothetical protein